MPRALPTHTYEAIATVSVAVLPFFGRNAPGKCAHAGTVYLMAPVVLDPSRAHMGQLASTLTSGVGRKGKL